MSGSMKKLAIKSFFVTALIFLILVWIALNFESSRVEEVRRSMAEIDVLWNDARFFNQYIANASEEECRFLFNENLKLGDRIYEEGLKIEKYEGANKLTDTILTEKKRYALLDLQFWRNSIDIKNKCGSMFSTVIYFYSQYNKTDEGKVMDRILWQLKQKCGSKIIYITFPADMGLSSINFIKNMYNITKTPAVIINERIVLSGLVSLEELNDYVNCW